MKRLPSASLAMLIVIMSCRCVPVMDMIGTPVDIGNSDDKKSQSGFEEFEDPDSDFSTMDVMDIDGQIVRFDAALRQMIWVEDSLAFDGWDVQGNRLSNGFFTVRFGSEDGVQMAYFTETNPPTICDISVNDGALSISSTDTTVPQN
jgi:hypothetical protein